LLTDFKTSAYYNYGKWSIGYYPAYKLLSSYVNSLLRTKKYEDALNLVAYSQSPKDILNSSKARMAKADVKKNLEDILRTCDSYEFQDLVVYIFNSEYRMSGYIASSLQDSMNTRLLRIGFHNRVVQLRDIYIVGYVLWICY
jgi:hypothetical protein